MTDATKAPAAFNPFDPAMLRAVPAHLKTLEPEMLVGVHKPEKTQFIRVRAGEEWRFASTYLYDRGGGGKGNSKRETYLVWANVAEALEGLCDNVALFTCISHHGNTFLWPCKLNLDNAWNVSALNAVDKCIKSWCQVRSSQRQQQYITTPADAGPSWGEPEWPNKTFMELLEAAFKDRVVTNMDHPLVQELQGRV